MKAYCRTALALALAYLLAPTGRPQLLRFLCATTFGPRLRCDIATGSYTTYRRWCNTMLGWASKRKRRFPKLTLQGAYVDRRANAGARMTIRAIGKHATPFYKLLLGDTAMRLTFKPIVFVVISSLSLPALADEPTPTPVQIVALDECDPATFNAVLGPDFCKNVALAYVTPFATTFSDLVSKAAAGTPDPGWDFEPDKLTIKKGTPLIVVDQGGELHTFTEVAQFGGGFIPPLNNQQAAVPSAPAALKISPWPGLVSFKAVNCRSPACRRANITSSAAFILGCV